MAVTSREYKQILSFFVEDDGEIEFLDEFLQLWKKFKTEVDALALYPNKNTDMARDVKKTMLEMCADNNFREYFIIEPVFEFVRKTKHYGRFINREGIDIRKLIML